MKRVRAPKAKPGEIKVQWGKLPHDAPDICYAWGEGTSKRDANLIISALCSKRYSPIDMAFEKSIVDELVERGYDITTLKFSIAKRPTNGS